MNKQIKELLLQSGVTDNWNEADWFSMSPAMVEKFGELIIQECAEKLVQANMTNTSYAQAMDEYYENKWAHRFD